MRVSIRSSKRAGTELVGYPAGGAWQQFRQHALRRTAEALDEIPGVLRHLRVFLLVASVTMAVFAAGLLVVLWKAVA